MWTRKSALLIGGAALSLFFALFFQNPRLLGIALVLLTYMAVVSLTTRYPEIAPSERPFILQPGHRPTSLRVTRQVHAVRVFEEQRVRVTLTIRRIGRARGNVEILDHLPATLRIVAGSNRRLLDLDDEEMTLDYTIEAPVMGPFVLGPVRLRWGDLSNMFYREYQIGGTHRSHRPALGPRARYPTDPGLRPRLFSGTTTVRKPGPGTEFFTLRDLVPGDDSRSINWKATSRRQHFMVNVHEREAITTSLIVVDATRASGYGKVDRTSLILSCRAAATLARSWIRRKENVGLVIYGERIWILNPSSGEGQLERVLVNLALARPLGDQRFAAVAKTVVPYLPSKSTVILFSAAESDQTLEQGFQSLIEADLKPVLVCPLLYPGEVEAGRRDEISADLVALEKDIQLDRLRFSGARAIQWDPQNSVEIPLREVGL